MQTSVRYRDSDYRLWLGAFIILILFSRSVSATQTAYIFCHNCNTQTSDLITGNLDDEDQKTLDALIAFEQGLDVRYTQRSTIPFEIVGAGSTGLALSISTLPGKMVRRLPGFYSFSDAQMHIQHIQEYRKRLHELGIATTDSQLIAIEPPAQTVLQFLSGSPGVVYVIQPYLEGDQLTRNYLHQASEDDIKLFFKKQFAIAERVLAYNHINPGNEVSVDIVMNNWELHFTTKSHYSLRLNDIAQPLYSVNGEEPYDWYDQAASVIYPVIGMTQDELKRQFRKLLNPREFFIQLLWGYESLNQRPVSHSLNALSNATYPLSNICESYVTYPRWAMQTVNRKIQALGLPELSPGEIYEAFKNNNYSIECFRIFREATAALRYGMSYLKYTHLLPLLFGPSNFYLTKKPDDTTVDMYQTEMRPGLGQCFMNPDSPY